MIAPLAPSPSASAVPPVPPKLPPVSAPVVGPVPSYNFDLKLDAPTRNLSGHAEIGVVNTSKAPLNEIYLRLWGNAPDHTRRGGFAQVSGMNVAGTAASNVVVDKTVVKVPLTTPLAPGASTTLSFEMNVQLPKDMGRTGVGAEGNLYFGSSLPILAVHDDEGWNLDPYVRGGEAFYSLAADWKVDIEASEALNIVTTGTEKVAGPAPKKPNGEPVRHSFESKGTRDFMVTALSGYKQLNKQVGGTSVRVWVPAGDTRVGPRMLDTASKSLEFFNTRYGVFNQPEMDVIAVRGMGGGMEYPGLTMNEMGSFGGDEVVAHENAHQWFYGMVGNNEFDDPWLDESFASFVTGEYLDAQRKPGISAPNTSVGHQHDIEGRIEPTPPTPPNQPPARVNISAPMHEHARTGRYFPTIYGQGATVLKELKQHLGEDTFVKGMRTWVAEQKNGIATTQNFIGTMSAVAGKDLTAWFEERRIVANEPRANDKLDPNGQL